jgi:hypothetical protein
MNEIQRVFLDEGKSFNPFKKRPYADFYVEIRHGTNKAISAVIRPFARAENKDTAPIVVIKPGEEAKVQGGYTIELPIDKIDMDEINDLFILGQVKAWSFGEVDRGVLDSMPEKLHERLVNEVNRLYGQSGPLAPSGGGN